MSAVPDHDPALTAALEYAARGWRVLPIKPGTKHPPIKAWQEAATTDAETIANWFTHLYRDHGVGIATGAASGVWVLDVDDWEALANLEEEHGPLPATYSVTTGSGGIHQYYAVPNGQTITNANQLPRGIDVRGEGGQVVAPPSMHPESGQAYTQEHSSPDTLAQAPAWLLELVRAPERPEAPERPTTPPVDAGHRPGDIWAATTSWSDILKPDGWQFAYTDPGGTEMWVRPGKEMREGVSASVGHKGSDVLKVFTSSLEGMGLSEGATYTKIGYLAATRHSGDHSAAAAWLASQGHRQDDREVIADMLGDFPNQAAPMIALPPVDPTVDIDATGQPIARQSSKLASLMSSAVNWHDLMSKPPAEADWLADSFLAKGRQHSLAASHKTGKSLFLLSTCARLAIGRDPFDPSRQIEPVKTLYLDMEMTEEDLRERLDDMGHTDPADWEMFMQNFTYLLLPNFAPLDTPHGAAELAEVLDHVQPDLIAIDTFSRVTVGDENDASTTQDFYKYTGIEIKRRKITSVRLDHFGKDTAKGTRGSSAKGDDVDVGWEIKATETGHQLIRQFARMGWVPEKVEFNQTSEPLGWEHGTTSWPKGTMDAVALLDQIEWPLDCGRPGAIAELKHQFPDTKLPRNEAMGAGIRYRRTRAAQADPLDSII
jgi:hypothetical protein